MRNIVSIVYIAIIIALGICAFVSYKSKKAIGKPLGLLLISLIPPVFANLLINVCTTESFALVGCYMYYLGMNFVMYAMLKYTFTYCNITWPNRFVQIVVPTILFLDGLQVLSNTIFHHAFTTEVIMVDGYPYYNLVPFLPQNIHRMVDFMVFVAIELIFFYKTVTTVRIYAEKYSVILLTMIVCGLWECFYIVSGTPINVSMIGFGVYGLMVFYFSLYYRPLRLLDQMLANIASDMPEALYFFDPNGQCIWANDPGIKFAGLENNDFSSALKKLETKFNDIDFDSSDFSCKKVLGKGENAEYYVLNKQFVTNSNNKYVGSFLSVRDETKEQKDVQEQIYNATHDSLTDLYVREYLLSEIRKTIDDNPDKDYLVIYSDVQEFKMINDVYGTEFGDYVLKEIAKKIMRDFNDDCVYGRLSGDVFGILSTVDDFDPEYLDGELKNFFVHNGNVEEKINVQAGIYKIDDRDIDPSVMFDRAHLALNTIKNDYNRNIVYYDDEMRDAILWNQTITAQFEEAIRTRQIRPYLQPIVDKMGNVVGAEALVRWIHPELGFLSPAKFVPVFENNGLICELDKYMWRSSCEILAKWQKEFKNLFISVNISPKDFYFMDVAQEIESIIKEYDIEPGRLRIEITETVMMSDIDNRMKILNDLKEYGFIVEMDDFGSGYSSLNLLKDMPVDVLKIDMAFLRGSKETDRAETIIHNIINLSDDLGIISLTEGVETVQQYDMLNKMGCKLFQGFHFSKPIPVEEFETLYLDNAPSAIN